MIAYDLQKYNNYKRLDKQGIVEIGDDNKYYIK